MKHNPNTNQTILGQPTSQKMGTHTTIIHKPYNKIAAQQTSSFWVKKKKKNHIKKSPPYKIFVLLVV